jgi:hypothetical protein
MEHAVELCSPCGRRSPYLIRAILTRLLARIPRRLDTVDPERWSRHMLRDVGLSE